MNLPKFQAAQKLFSSISAGEDVSKFLGSLCEAGRLDLFSKARSNYFKLVMAAGNGVEVRVVSAVVRRRCTCPQCHAPQCNFRVMQPLRSVVRLKVFTMRAPRVVVCRS